MVCSCVSAADFTQILNDMGRIVSYQVATKTDDSFTGDESSAYASASNQTVVFFLEDQRYIWDKEGLLSVGDAYIIAPPALGIKRYDKFTIDSQTFIIQNVTKRHVLGTAMCDWATCMKVN